MFQPLYRLSSVSSLIACKYLRVTIQIGKFKFRELK